MKSPSLYWCSIYRPANLFPKSYLEEQRITNSQRVSNIANRAYVEWGENIDNSDQSPSEYFPKYAARFDEGELEQIMYWHALPGDGTRWTTTDSWRNNDSG